MAENETTDKRPQFATHTWEVKLVIGTPQSIEAPDYMKHMLPEELHVAEIDSNAVAKTFEVLLNDMPFIMISQTVEKKSSDLTGPLSDSFMAEGADPTGYEDAETVDPDDEPTSMGETESQRTVRDIVEDVPEAVIDKRFGEDDESDLGDDPYSSPWNQRP